MFNSKLKKQIEALSNSLDNAYDRIRCNERTALEQSNEIKKLKFKVDNPPKHKIGDRIDGCVVFDVYFSDARRWGYSYKLVNTKTGETKTI